MSKPTWGGSPMTAREILIARDAFQRGAEAFTDTFTNEMDEIIAAEAEREYPMPREGTSCLRSS